MFYKMIHIRYIANNKTVIRTVDVQKHPAADERGGSLPRGLLTTGIYKKVRCATTNGAPHFPAKR